MLKFFFLVICLTSKSAFSQKVFIREIKRRPDSETLNVKYSTIIYPIIIARNSKVAKLINDKIWNEILESDEGNGDLNIQLDKMIKNGLTDIMYEITYNKNNFLSLYISIQKEEFHHIYRSTTYLNFDLITGLNLHIYDLINSKKIDSFKKKVFQDKIRYLKKYKNEELRNYLTGNKIDSSNYKWAFEQVDSNCINSIELETFSLTNFYFKIINPCEFSDAAKWLEPTYELKYAYKYMYMFLKPRFQKALLK